MTLTTEQLEALERGEAVPVTVDDRECILISAEAYQKMHELLSPEDTYPAVLEAWDSTGSPQDAEYER